MQPTAPAADSLAARLASAMRARNLTQRGLADLVTKTSGDPLSQVAIQKIASGATRHPKRLPDVAAALGVTVEWLVHGGNIEPPAVLASGGEVVVTDGNGSGRAGGNGAARDATDNAEHTAKTIKPGVVPVVGTAQLGENGFFDDEPAGTAGFLRIHSDDASAYALRVVGDSMAPRIKHGEFVLVEPGRPLVPFEECLVQTADGRKMIKVFAQLHQGFYRFDSVNDDHRPIHLAAAEVVAVHYVAGILKHSRFFSD